MSDRPLLTLSDEDDICRVAEVLSSRSRLAIIQACQDGYLSISELCGMLRLPQSTVTDHIKGLEKAGLLEVRSEPGRHGRRKLCRSIYSGAHIEFPKNNEADPHISEVEMPVGLYASTEVAAPCGLASPEACVGYMDYPDSFLLPERMAAGIIWFGRGWVEYRFPRLWAPDSIVEWVELSFEACSEAVTGADDRPSEIVVWMNGIKVGAWTCTGGYGHSKGKLTPPWWPVLYHSQYGELKTLTITADGSFADGEYSGPTTPVAIGLPSAATLDVRIGTDPSGVQGGVNIFGNTFGNYAQGIKLRVKASARPEVDKLYLGDRLLKPANWI